MKVFFSGRSAMSAVGLMLGGVLFLAVNALSTGLLKGINLDFTQEGLFTLSDGTRTILGEIEEPITLRLFYSEKLGEAVPSYTQYAARVRELLDRYAAIAGGGIRLEIYDPEPFSREEDLAVSYGLQGVPVNQGGDLVYFGLAGTGSTDEEKTIAFFQGDRERFLEYDLTRLVAELARPNKKVVGLLSGLPMAGGPGNPMVLQMGNPMAGRSPPWMIMEQISRQFEVRHLSNDLSQVDADVDVLMVVHPKDLAERTLYAIDQFVMGGGKALIFVDPYAESDPAGQVQGVLGGMGGMPGSTGSGLPKLFDAWGIVIDGEKVVGDRRAATRVSTGAGAKVEVLDHLAWLGLGAENLNRGDVVTGNLSTLFFASAGSIELTGDSPLGLTPLVTTSTEAMEIDALRFMLQPDFKALARDFVSADREFVLAARLEGPLPSAFPDGPPPSSETEGAETQEDGPQAQGEASAGHMGQSLPADHIGQTKSPVTLIVVADADLLEDRFWVQVQNFFGQRIAIPTSGNADFVVNALDNLSGNEALIGLRSRGQTARPFGLVRDIQLEAEQRYRDKEQLLEERLAETERKLADLETKANPDAGGGAPMSAPLEIILSPEQYAAIEEFRAEMLDIRAQLREVQLALRRDIDTLGAWLKFINIALMPLLIAFGALGLVWWRRRRHGQGAAAREAP